MHHIYPQKPTTLHAKVVFLLWFFWLTLFVHVLTDIQYSPAYAPAVGINICFTRRWSHVDSQYSPVYGPAQRTTILLMIGLELLINFYVTMSGQNFSYKFPQQRAGYQLVLIMDPAHSPIFKANVFFLFILNFFYFFFHFTFSLKKITNLEISNLFRFSNLFKI
jgi:hypothetical protein